MLRRILTQRDIQILIESRGSLPLLDQSLQTAVTVGDPTPLPVPKPDDYATKVIKLIPAEVVTIFVTLDGIIRSTNEALPGGVYWALFGILAIATYFYMLRATKVDGLQTRKCEALLAALSFIVWVFAIGGPFTYAKVGWYKPVYGALLLPLYTFLIPLIFPKK